MAFAETLRVLNTMKAEGVIQEYAIVGAMAIVFWTEPVLTFDLDVLVLLPPPEGTLVSLDRIYRWAESRRSSSPLRPGWRARPSGRLSRWTTRGCSCGWHDPSI